MKTCVCQGTRDGSLELEMRYHVIVGAEAGELPSSARHGIPAPSRWMPCTYIIPVTLMLYCTRTCVVYFSTHWYCSSSCLHGRMRPRDDRQCTHGKVLPVLAVVVSPTVALPNISYACTVRRTGWQDLDFYGSNNLLGAQLVSTQVSVLRTASLGFQVDWRDRGASPCTGSREDPPLPQLFFPNSPLSNLRLVRWASDSPSVRRYAVLQTRDTRLKHSQRLG